MNKLSGDKKVIRLNEFDKKTLNTYSDYKLDVLPKPTTGEIPAKNTLKA